MGAGLSYYCALGFYFSILRGRWQAYDEFKGAFVQKRLSSLYTKCLVKHQSGLLINTCS